MQSSRIVAIAAVAFVTTSCGLQVPGFTKPAPAPEAPPAVAAASPAADHAAHGAAHHPTAPRREMPEGAGAPLFGDLGAHHYPITTASKAAQRYFDQGLILTYGFNHAEAIRSYREASRLDPDCAMCAWGEAYALGPNINKPMDDADVPAAWQAAQRALAASKKASARERALVEALAKRYAKKPVADRSALDRAYAAAMRKVAKAYPEDLDVQTLYVESVMTTMPWDYYRADGKPKPETVEIVDVLETVMRKHPDHPGAIHFYIHAVEPSERPERAEAPSDRLRDLIPGAGHLVHMPSHIYLRVGRYADASLANEKAAAADESYITQCKAQGFYPAAYYSHNIHFLWASAGFEGRKEVSVGAAKKLVSVIPDAFVDEIPLVEEFLPTYLVGLARFGDWPTILEQPKPAEKRRYLTGMWHYTRGLALAATGKKDEAKTELAQVKAIRDEWAKGDLVFLSGSKPDQLLSIAANVLEARIAGESGRWKDAVAPLRKAVAMQDTLPYTEPPPFYFPTREALGHALLESGKAKEAEEVYRTQLTATPRNGWSLLGLARSLEAQGRADEAADVERRFEAAWQQADVKIASSIY